MEHLTTFHNGFQAIAEVVAYPDKLTYKAKNVYNACDKARLRILQLGLPLFASVTSINTFVVKPL